MRIHPVAKRYARAFFELAEGKNKFDSLYGEVKSFATILEQDKSVAEYFYSPNTEKAHKIETLDKIFKEKLDPMVYQFILLLLQKNRIEFFEQIVFFLERFADKKHNRLNAVVTTVIPVSDTQKQDITKLLSESFKANIVLENKVDPEILGGIIVQVEGQIVDDSLLSQLKTLRHELLKSEAFA